MSIHDFKLPHENFRRTRPGSTSDEVVNAQKPLPSRFKCRHKTILPLGICHRLSTSPLGGVLAIRAARPFHSAKKKRCEVGKPRTRRQWLVSPLYVGAEWPKILGAAEGPSENGAKPGVRGIARGECGASGGRLRHESCMIRSLLDLR
jgi:hypothetical protein